MNTDTTDAGIDYKAFGASFINITAGPENKVNLCDLKIAREGTGSSYYTTVNLQVLNGNGTTKVNYYWIYNRTHGDKSGTEGWYSDVMGAADKLITPESGVVFNAADGFWLKGNSKIIVSSGAVLTGTQVTVDTTPAGIDYVMIANPYPVAVNLADITVDRTGTGSAFYTTVNAQILNNNGTTKTNYYWIYNRTHGDKSGIEGWYSDVMGVADKLITKETGILLQPGEAYWVKGNQKTIRFPALNID